MPKRQSIGAALEVLQTKGSERWRIRFKNESTAAFAFTLTVLTTFVLSASIAASLSSLPCGLGFGGIVAASVSPTKLRRWKAS
jgi:hypothetical protein